MKLDALKKSLENKKILILGFGREGMATLKFLQKIFPQKQIGIADQDNTLKKKNIKLKNVKWHLGKNYLKSLKKYDLIIKSPGIPIHLKEIEKAFKEKKITSQTEIFLNNCPGKIIGVTATKGKSTTSSLIYQILKDAGIKVHLVGNIGQPVLNYLFSATPNDIYVFELSAHQLYNLKKSPHIAIFLNIFPEHLDYYKNFKEYLNAKANITKFQAKNDYFIYDPENDFVKKVAIKTKAQKISISELKVRINKKTIPVENIKAAICVARIFKIPYRKIVNSIKKFKPLPHRLEKVGVFKGIIFFNDALSTIPETSILAMKILGKKVQTVILGGFDRKINFRKLGKYILENKNIKNLILFPTTGKKIWQTILSLAKGAKKALPSPFFVDNMKDAVKIAYQHTQKGKICLLSCASSSFSLFKDYKEKGNLFKRYIKQYSK